MSVVSESLRTLNQAIIQKLAVAMALTLILISACSDQAVFRTNTGSDFFVQDYNPPYLDVLWVLDDRSPMHRASGHVVREASLVFKRLDDATSNYRMEFVTSDMQFAKGALKLSEPITKNVGDVNSRTSNFAAIFQNVINLGTGGLSQGLAAAEIALSRGFKPQDKIPMIVIFISDSYDVSDLPTASSDRTTYYSERLLSLVGGKKELLRSYAINYTTDGTRCATEYDSDIDRDASHAANPYVLVAKKLSGSAADLCGAFGSTIDLSGIRLKQLPSRFKLSAAPTQEIQVIITKRGNRIIAPKWSYDKATNEIVFETAPEEGSTIQVIR